jgi:hypothetical protein
MGHGSVMLQYATEVAVLQQSRTVSRYDCLPHALALLKLGARNKVNRAGVRTGGPRIPAFHFG